MTARTVIPGLLAVALLAAFIGYGWHSQRVLEADLPPRTVAADALSARAAADAYALAQGGSVLGVQGTGSMAPLIPAAALGRDPHALVAYIVTAPGATYSDIAPGQLCLYRASWEAGLVVLHVAAQQDHLGWIMSGLHNPRSEPHWRVTPDNFLGIAARVYVWNP